MYTFVVCLLYLIGNVFGEGPSMGKGIWIVNEVSTCVDEDFPYAFEVNKTRIDRATEAYNLYTNLLDQIDEFCPIKMIICIYKDGGCKPYQTLSDDSTKRFSIKYAEPFIIKAFIMAKLENLDFPIPKGEYILTNYTMGPCDFPKYAPYGDFEATAIIMKNGQAVICVHVTLSFVVDEDGICPDEEEEK